MTVVVYLLGLVIIYLGQLLHSVIILLAYQESNLGESQCASRGLGLLVINAGPLLVIHLRLAVPGGRETNTRDRIACLQPTSCILISLTGTLLNS